MFRFRWVAEHGAAGVAVLIGLLGAGLIGVAVAGPALPPRAPGVSVPDRGTETPHPPRDRAGVEDLITGPVLPVASPVGLTIPRLKVATHLVALGVDETGAMEVPDDPADAGWYERGPAPGSLGPAVIAGHVTWSHVPGVFFRLGELRHGDVVRVARDDGQEAVFEVTRVARFGKTRFPTDAVFGKTSHAGLRLITCGGEYDSASRRYRDNVVVFASLVAERQAKRKAHGT